MNIVRQESHLTWYEVWGPVNFVEILWILNLIVQFFRTIRVSYIGSLVRTNRMILESFVFRDPLRLAQDGQGDSYKLVEAD